MTCCTCLLKDLLQISQSYMHDRLVAMVKCIIYLKCRRSHKHLLELPSRLFYREALLPFASKESVKPPDWNELNDPIISQEEANMLFYGVRGQQVNGSFMHAKKYGMVEYSSDAQFSQVQDGDAPSFYNPIEAEKLVELLLGLLYPDISDGLRFRNRVSPEHVGVICTYRKQVRI